MNNIPSFSIGELFGRHDNYVIPIYQRNYTWGQGEIKQLIQDIYDFAFDDHKCKQPYYIGSLIIYEREVENKISFETIDGQQRLTTLKILLHALHHTFKDDLNYIIPLNLKLSFDSRKKSTASLAAIEKGNIDTENSQEYNVYIKQRYLDAQKILKSFLTTKDAVLHFYKYLIANVCLIRVPVPPETDLNHYFEIMNNRGEQLEKHEVLKASLLNVLKSDPDLCHAFNLIWEACSDMERYVQYGFSPKQRSTIFTKNWNKLDCSSLDEVAVKINQANIETFAEKSNSIDAETELNICEIIEFKGAFEVNKNHNEEAPERFNSVINFSNFLLHVLRIQTQKNISLDDKRLKDFFDVELKLLSINEQVNFVKAFGFNLLKTKHLFDQYIIKREFFKEKDQWSLKTLKLYDNNRVGYVNTFDQEESNDSQNKEILMLLAMFHVSTPTLVYKHWLNAALNYLFNEQDVNPENYRIYLQNLAQAYLFDRFIAENPTDYFDIIYSNKGVSINKQHGNYNLNLLDRGTAVENFVFNYLDYILWKQKSDQSAEFEFTFRSSVEHYYPQNPISKEHKIDRGIFDLFGNLCLISSSKNSKLSNHMPAAKKDFYAKEGPDSLKQVLMMKEEIWTEDKIKQQGNLMKEKLVEFSKLYRN
ncbi:DUF262 domain-containing protein [Pedobacter sp. 22226]|uniref:DUF262 domain-containing protein n=1 Tax=Pedobacter sp. 22226 TaxID=3453894 RepID=UPI003F86D489